MSESVTQLVSQSQGSTRAGIEEQSTIKKKATASESDEERSKALPRVLHGIHNNKIIFFSLYLSEVHTGRQVDTCCRYLSECVYTFILFCLCTHAPERKQMCSGSFKEISAQQESVSVFRPSGSLGGG